MSFEPRGEYQQMGDWGGMVKYGNDAQLHVMFFMKSVPNALKSQAAGARFHEDVPYIRIQHPGERDQVIERPVKEDDKRRFAARWRAFEEGREQITDGIPIDMLYPSHPAIADNLRSYGVHTIEQAAKMSSHAMDSIGMGAQEIQNRAKDYLEAASAGANFHKFKAEREGLELEVQRLKHELATLSAQFASVMGQIRQGVPVPGAMVPQAVAGIGAMPRPLPGIPDVAGPSRGADVMPLESTGEVAPRHDLMANLPKAGKVRAWAKKEGAQ